MAATIEAQLRGHFDYWCPILGLEGWNVTLRFDEKKLQAYCDAKPKYLEATIGFNPKRIQRELKTPEAREELVLHEMVHAVAWKASETTVSQITYSLLRARAYGRRVPG